MKKYQLTFVDTISVQSYIFSSNILKHIIGASELVYKATNEWAFDILFKLGKTNVDCQGKIDQGVHFPDSDLFSELIYAGGGNALILFADGKEKEFARQLSLKVLSAAPGLEIVIVHEEVDYDEVNQGFIEFKSKINEVMKKAGIKKQNRHINAPMPGLGFTTICPYTGRPATGRDGRNRVSSDILKKLEAVDDAEKRLKITFKQNEYFFDDFNAIEGEEKGSYIAVVHSDGTDMGKRIEDVLNHAPDDKDGCTREIRALSDSIKEVSSQAMQATIERLVCLVTSNKIERIKGCLPIRPIVFGGDDVTFVCQGMVGLSMAAFHLQQLEKTKLSDKNPLYARSGVAVVKSHFPFSQAYQMAEALCRNARQAAKKAAVNDVPPAMIDWFFSSSGPVLDLDRTRAQKYTRKFTTQTHELMMRPVVIWGNFRDYEDWRTWKVFSDLVTAFKGKHYEDKVSKLKGLLGELAENRSTFKHYLDKARLKMPKVEDREGQAEEGWIGHRSLYHDALEAMDFFTEF